MDASVGPTPWDGPPTCWACSPPSYVASTRPGYSPEPLGRRQRRYSRAELTVATRVRALLDESMPLIAGIRIVSLERRLQALTYASSTLNRKLRLNATVQW